MTLWAQCCALTPCRSQLMPKGGQTAVQGWQQVQGRAWLPGSNEEGEAAASLRDGERVKTWKSLPVQGGKAEGGAEYEGNSSITGKYYIAKNRRVWGGHYGKGSDN